MESSLLSEGGLEQFRDEPHLGLDVVATDVPNLPLNWLLVSEGGRI
jgi:hypothetical protein